MSLVREAFFSFPTEFVSVHWLASSIVEWSLNVHPESAAARRRRGKIVNRDQKDQLSPPPRNVPCTPSNVIHSQSK